MNLLLAAIDFGEIIGLIIIVLTILGSLVNFISGKNQPQAPRPQQRRPQQPQQRQRGDKISNEIEIFLQEVTGRKPQQPVPERPSPQPTAVPEQPKPRRVVTQRPAPAPPGAPERKPLLPALPETPARPGSALHDRKGPGSHDLGTGVRTHLGEYMDPSRLEKQVAQDLRSNVPETVQAHLGRFSAERATTSRPLTRRKNEVHPLVALLRNPDGVRQAILIKEVLERPKISRRLRRK